ncbi:protein-L-isoaspartate(D-aspartate) O-methyltransferase [Lacisediminimonas sp.]|uniref:protein-L-isoaspartate(D-aspartate) O-methyltransferase n=1 Tax=Lacisediminimonas sp. TaxID=3060582 RepID=UPI00271DF069|nr:protein-L-isoaspartate(D-aspartate) O-methyltransferase [Lacisediminimonas sp.]MDO8301278.1 protein-L-isoaspartate(D-aspartate) O-methyltransferase [Lacisediminimonas sp.]
MNKEGKRFPLSLAELSDRGSRKTPAEPAGGRARTPQTATRNAAGNHASDGGERSQRGPVTGPVLGNAGTAGVKRASPVPVFQADRQAPVVSDGIRRAMVERLAQQGIRDTKVLAAMQAVPRHLFIEPALVSQAYIDASLPIGHHQTISQPYIVARMIEVMRDNGWGGKLDRVLEIGTGCGYQAAVLSLLATEVYSIERIRPLHELAKTNLRPLRIANIRLQFGDGMLGLAQVAPFDGIILAAAGLEVPTALLEQLRIGGRLVAPVGGRHQVLQLIERKSKFDWSTATLEDCHFVPLRPGTA